MKKTVWITAALALALAAAACSTPTDSGHVHDYEWSVTTPATCTDTGVKTGVCKLDRSHTATQEIAIDPNAHNYQTYAQTTPPTCLLNGEEQAACARSNTHTKGTRAVAALGHDWDFDNARETKAPTCTTPGDGTIDCKRQGCGEERDGIGQIPINPDAHNYENYTQTTAPTCSAKGIDTGTCTYNNAHKDPREGADIDPNAHNWNTETGVCDNNSGELYYSLGAAGPGGGKIFYRTAAGFTVQMVDPAQNYTAHYLEAAPSDMTLRAWLSSAYTSTSIAGTETAIGAGRKNTALILATDANAPAAKACNDYSNGGKTDWFLPSKDELTYLYQNRASVGNLNTNYDSRYWSSSQAFVNSDYPWSRRFSDGEDRRSDGKSSMLSVRAVRAF